MALKPGDAAPDFTLPSTVGDKVTFPTTAARRT